METSLDEILLGENGKRVVKVDVAGQELGNLEAPLAPVPGDNVVLTLDTRLQKAAEAALVDEINYWTTFFGTTRISSAVVIAMNPKTGEILAMVSYPTFENNRMARFIPGYYYEQIVQDPRRPLVNNAISAEFPPGSVFKLSTATGAYNEGVITPDMTVETPGKLVLCERFRPTDPFTPANSRYFVDWIYERNGVINEAGFGVLDFFHCIAYSSNVCFYKLGKQRHSRVDVAHPATIHRVRVAFKSFRYMVEITHPLVPDFPNENLKRMNDYQSLMGEIQDAEVFARSLADFTDHASLPDPELVRRYEEQRHTDAIYAYLAKQNQLDVFWRGEPEQPFPWETIK